jgi:hypothetical protein
MAETHNPASSLQQDSTSGLPTAQKSTSNAAHVATPSDVAGTGVQFIIRDLTTTLQTLTIPSGAKSLVISYRLLPGATATANQFAKYVINAANAAVAAGLLATDNAFIPLFQGDDHVLSFSAGSEATRVDIITEQAVGSEKTVVSVRGVI